VHEINLNGQQQLGFEYLGEDRMLCIQNDHLTLVDCRADTVLVDSSIILGEGHYSAAHTGDGKKLYFAHDGSLGVLRSSSLSLISAIDWPYARYNGEGYLIYSDTTHKLYWFSGYDDSMLAIDARGDTVVSRIADSVSGRFASLDHTGRYMFCTGFYNSRMRVYDTQTDSLVGTYPQPQYPRSIIPAPEQHCIYVGFDDLVLAYPDIPPGVEEASNDEWEPMNAGASVVHGDLLYEPASDSRGKAAAELVDVSGRRVKELQPGANNVHSVPPGIYFVRTGELARTRKIVIAR
jgi:hypothetical protein